MDRKTAYTRTFLMLKDETIHDESVKTAYFTWWQNVRENYESRSLRLTKPGFRIIEELDLKTETAVTLSSVCAYALCMCMCLGGGQGALNDATSHSHPPLRYWQMYGLLPLFLPGWCQREKNYCNPGTHFP